jgi:CheY-like chemotaxis protein
MAKILYVEDNPAQADILAKMLEVNGYEVAVASDGVEGVEKARTWLPDLILMDLRMPRMDGYEATKIIRLESETTHIPILALSVAASSKHKERALAVGMNEHFTKPVDLNRLLSAIARYVGEDTTALSEKKSKKHRSVSSEAKEGLIQTQKDRTTKKLNLSKRATQLTLGTSSTPSSSSQKSESASLKSPIFHNPYIAGPPITDPKMFFGREQILLKIINTLHNNHIMITGPRRIGKTTLLYQLKNRLITLNDSAYSFVPIMVDVQGTPEQDFFHTVMDDIVTALPEYLSKQAISALDFDHSDSKYNSRVFGKDLGKIIKALRQNSPGKTVKLILLMDEMDVMNSYNQRVQSQLRSIFQKPFAHNLGVVVAGTDLRQQWERYESPFYNMFTPLTLKPFSLEEARQLILKPVASIYQYDDKAVTKILEETGGHPFRLQQLCREIIQRVTEKKRKRITLVDVETTLETIQWIEEESGQDSKKDFIQQESTTTAVLAEKPAPYNSSSSLKKDKPE